MALVSAREASYAIYGAWRLARLDASGVQFFGNTVEAFWRSFWAAAIALPPYALMLLMRLADSPVSIRPFTAALVEVIAYIAGWTAFPLAMFYVARMFDRGTVYLRYIAAYNWSVVLQVALLLGVTALAASGLLPQAAGALLSLAATLAILTYQWFIARAALNATIGGAVAIVALDLMLGIAINGWANRIVMAGAAVAPPA